MEAQTPVIAWVGDDVNPMDVGTSTLHIVELVIQTLWDPVDAGTLTLNTYRVIGLCKRENHIPQSSPPIPFNPQPPNPSILTPKAFNPHTPKPSTLDPETFNPHPQNP